ncbi:hypothetical protein C7M84_001563 [Penaeus vannamei]|uniref:Uncharacterized protein n=1 Tax=Penaeus vannamei TaxID=6689 RepID=A0A3R7MEM6_PENVA|nr:hypothetical protein C7M84_001563 [Penaeus vannamei]
MELKNVYERYQARLRNSAFLGVVSIGALASCCLLGTMLHGSQSYEWSPAAVILCCYLGFLLLIIGMAQQVFTANISVISAILATTFWLITASILVSVGILHQPKSSAHLTPPAFLLVLITHTTVPLRRAHTRILAGISTLLPLVTMLASPALTWGVRQEPASVTSSQSKLFKLQWNFGNCGRGRHEAKKWRKERAGSFGKESHECEQQFPRMILTEEWV